MFVAAMHIFFTAVNVSSFDSQICAAYDLASSRTLSAGTTLLTSPILRASFASILLPVNDKSLARPSPTTGFRRV